MVAIFVSKVKERKAFEEARIGAEEGNSRDQYELGFFYSTGQGAPQDSSKALTWYQRAADQGDAMGENGLGFLYANGRGVPQDYAQALLWYRKAAAQGNAKAEYNIGNMLYYGKGIPIDRTEANLWFVKAANLGDENAQRIIGTRWMGQDVTSRIVLPLISLLTVLYLASALRRGRSLLEQQYRALALTALIGIVFQVGAIYWLLRTGIAHSLFFDHACYLTINIILGSYVVQIAALVWPAEWKLASARIAFGLCGIMLVGLDIYAGMHLDLLLVAAVLRLSYLVNGLLVGMMISIAVSRSGRATRLSG